ncbi:MAG: hypothetical protein GXP27_09890 [Planctomycetes bacterium]|nr:hypothetical protein [Planctomycetota bacterium]
MKQRFFTHVLLLLVVLSGTVLFARLAEAESAGTSTVVLRFEFQRKGNQVWTGQLRLSHGRFLTLEARPGTASTSTGEFRIRPRRQGRRRARRGTLLVTCTVPPAAQLQVVTNNGEFSLTPAQLAMGQSQRFLKQRVTVTRVTAARRLTDEKTEDDWPAAALGPDGSVWVAYLAYQNGSPIDAERIHTRKTFQELVPKGNGDQIRLLRYDGRQWSGPWNVTDAGMDLWRPAVAVASDGRVWLAWSQNFRGDWNIVVRSFDPADQSWSKPRVIRRPEGADINPVAAADRKSGAIYLAWQGWRDGAFDIWVARVDQNAVQPRAITETAANEWNPAAACDSQGRLHVAFDTYENGNYDVKLVVSAHSQSPRTVVIADSPLFEARASLAIDSRDRVWVAYEEGGPYWGKDFGTRWGQNFGEQFYLRRDIRVRCLVDGAVRQAAGVVPAEPVMNRYTPSGEPGPARKISMPRIGFDSAGQLWLLYRRHASTSGQGERWVSFATRHRGDGWAPAFPLSRSENQLDNRPAVVSTAAGLLVIHSCDGRTAGSSSRQDNDLFATLLPSGPATNAPKLVALPTVKPAPPSGHPDEAEDIARLRSYRARIGSKEYRLLRGEFHRHTELTSHRDQDGMLEEIWRYGLDVARMDWIGDGDHDNGGGKEYLWWLVQKQTDLFHHPPTFVPMFTYERSVRYPSGHRNVMFAYRGVRPLPRFPGGKEKLYGDAKTGSPDIKTLYAYLKHFDGICAIHTSATNMGTDWRDNDPEVEPVVEIYQGHRQNYEHDGAPGSAKDAKDSIGGYQPLGFVWNALMRGYRLGFEVSSDHISTHISYAVVFAEDASRKAILEGFKKRHCYGANDNILLDVRCGEHMMGDEFETDEAPTLEVYAVGTDRIANVSIVRGVGSETPEYVYRATPNQREIRLRWTDAAPPPPGSVAYYYVRIEQVKPEGAAYGALAWASPMWIHFK